MTILTIRLDSEAKTATFKSGGIVFMLHDVEARLTINSEQTVIECPEGGMRLAYHVQTPKRYFTLSGNIVESDHTVEDGDGTECDLPAKPIEPNTDSKTAKEKPLAA